MKRYSKALVPSQPRPVDRMRETMELVTTASVLSGQNLLVIGEPGFGKTSYLDNIARFMAGGTLEEGGHYLKIECSPGKRPSAMEGHENPMYSLVLDPQERGISFWQYKGTPRDPDVKLVLLNEVQRLADVVKDALLPVMDVELNSYNKVVFFADSNFVSNNPQMLAFEDRFGIRAWIDGIIPPPATVVHAKPSRLWTFAVPDRQRIVEVQDALLAFRINGEGTDASGVIIDALTDIIEGCGNTQFVMSPRRQHALMSILYSMTVHETGQMEFDTLSPSAWRAAAYAYPSMNQMDAIAWRGIVMKCVDSTASALAAFESNAIQTLRLVMDEISKERNKTLQQKQQAFTRDAGAKFQSMVEELERDFDPNSISVQTTKANINAAYVAAYRALK